MAEIPLRFRKSQEPQLIFSYSDVANGNGVLELQCFTAKTNAATSYLMTSYFPYSADIYLDLPDGTTTTLNFDLSAFTASRIITGKAFVSGYVFVSCTGGYGQTLYLTIKVQKWNGSSATDLGTAVTPNYSNSGVGTKKYFNFCVPISLTETKFNPGEILRLQIAGTVSGGYGGSAIYCDPKDRDASTATYKTSQLILSIPIKIST